MENDEDHLELIKSLFLKRGASEQQAHTMAYQLLKRAGQIAGKRKVSLVEAVETLLQRIFEAQEADKDA